jgi:PLP dependent protein
MKDIEDSIKRIKERMADACARAGRHESDVRLIGVTKYVDIERIRYAALCGLKDFGENYIQEAKGKVQGNFEIKEKEGATQAPARGSLSSHSEREGVAPTALPVEGATQAPAIVHWHMIGHIQMNKVKYIPELFDYIHSVDRWELLEALDKYGKQMKILFELNLSGEVSKHGTDISNLEKMLEKSYTLRYVKPAGLMTMAPFVDNPEKVRDIFRKLKGILETVNRKFSLQMKELSMGMSSDFEVAIEEGATMVRIGTAIFGERS